ncbi:hypothetical protein [Calidifontibacter indicus]|uniref:hypothetical protein n=1 Tax=Calidifontibacter indicus TaxID=419650 RepID=UPI003D71A31B
MGSRTAWKLSRRSALSATAVTTRLLARAVFVLGLASLLAGCFLWATKADSRLVVQAILASCLVTIGAGVAVLRGRVQDIGLVLFLLVDWVRGVLVVTIDATYGPPEFHFRSVSSYESTVAQNWVALAFSTSVVLFALALPFRRSANQRDELVLSDTETRHTKPGLLIFIGLIGLVIRFPSLGAASAYLSGSYEELSRAAAGPIGYAGSVMRTMLPIGLFILMTDRTRSKLLKLVCFVLLGPLALLALASFSLNRASIIFPVGAMVAAYALTVAPLRLRAWVSMGVAAALAFLVLGGVRTTAFNVNGGQDSTAGPVDIWGSLRETVELYGQSPYLPGIMHDESIAGRFSAIQPINSVLAAVPGIGREARLNSGTSLYNYAIYGKSGIQDQIVPVWAEVNAALGLSGLILAALVLVLAGRFAGSWLLNHPTPLGAYAAVLSSLWIAQASISSIQAITQAFLYSVIPAVLLAALARARQLSQTVLAQPTRPARSLRPRHAAGSQQRPPAQIRRPLDTGPRVGGSGGFANQITGPS